MSAQSEPLSVLTVNNGLSSGTILHSMFDSRGFLWVSTNEGLHRYDGKNIVKFFPNQKDSTAIHSQIILTMAEDKRGRIFIAGEAIEVFLPEENRFQVISNDRHEYYQPGPAIWIFEEDQLGIELFKCKSCLLPAIIIPQSNVFADGRK